LLLDFVLVKGAFRSLPLESHILGHGNLYGSCELSMEYNTGVVVHI